ncbi:DUF1671-domain-containing protein [Poronia punctata]|nr:DUF1671-domain-containing protein [Poronia punctata]
MAMEEEDSVITCPLCGFATSREYAILVHMEELHPEDQPLSTTDTGSVRLTRETQPSRGSDPLTDSDDEAQFIDCPIEGCLEQITLTEIEDHIDLHAIEEDDDYESTAVANADTHNVAAAAEIATVSDAHAAPATEDTRGYQSPYSRREEVSRPSERHSGRHSRPTKNTESTREAWKKLFGYKRSHQLSTNKTDLGTDAPQRRLGKSELGKHAYENQMPKALVALLEREKYNSAEGVIPALGRILEQNPTTRYAYLCHPAVQHISKLRNEGGFCGYRNIQMLASYIVGSRAVGADKFGGHIPSIFEIQDYIEGAWDMGINSTGRIETGGVKGTRKFIGTPEAQAVFLAFKIPCGAEGFRSPKEGEAEAGLLASVQQYFQSAPFEAKGKVHYTNLPPIYFQHRGHSMTIVGIESRSKGALELLVFDPMFRAPAAITQLSSSSRSSKPADNESRTRHHHHHHQKKVAMSLQHRLPGTALNMYRRGNKYLRKYTEFELLKLTPHTHLDA